MFNVNKLDRMERRVNKLLSVFTNLISQLEQAILEFKTAMSDNNMRIEKLQDDNALYSAKITEYESLKKNVESIVH